MSTYALLVGVNDYLNPRINPLQGCENDIDLVADTLKQRFGVPSDNIIKLKSGTKGSEASRQNIIDCFHEHLIDKAQQGDVAIFYFSGHGAQAKTHPDYLDIEQDGFDETLVCYDSRQADIPDLRDKDLRFLIAELARRCCHISVFLDCCHSGGGTRVIGHEKVRARLAPADTQSYPNTPYLHAQATTRSVESIDESVAELPASGKHVLLSGCRDYQLSEETMLGAENRRHGRFTHALCNVLNTIQYPISYHELRSRIHTSIHRKQKDQSPQLEAIGGADKRSVVFGGELLPLNLIAYYHDADSSWKLNAGTLHGYSKGDVVSLYEGQLVDGSESFVSGVIKTTTAHESLFNLTDGAPEAGQKYTATVSRQHLSKIGVQLVSNDLQLNIDLAVALEKEAGPQDLGRYLQIETEQPFYEIHHDDRGFYAVQPSVTPEPVFKAQDNLKGVLTQIAIMARWWEKLELQNPETKLPADAVDLVLMHGGTEYCSEDVCLRYTQGEAGEWIKPEFTLELRLKPDYPISKKLYCGVLFFDGSTGEVSSLSDTVLMTHKQGFREGQPNVVNVLKLQEGIPYKLKFLPELLEAKVNYIEDYIKLIISEKEFDASVLNQDGAELAVSRLGSFHASSTVLQNIIPNCEHRSLETSDSGNNGDWNAYNLMISLKLKG